MNVFLICQTIDLGYHVEFAYLDENKAKEVCQKMNDEHQTKLINNLITGCGYTREDAIAYACRADSYFIESRECLS